MKITKDFLGEGCGKSECFVICGRWSLKHNEYYYCDECSKKFTASKQEVKE